MDPNTYKRPVGDYGMLRTERDCVAREERPALREDAVQSLWYQQEGLPKLLKTEQGQRLLVVSPGWWNRGEGPDFLGAQLQFNGRLKTGDVEVHLRQGDWRAHGHDADPRYDEVVLHVVLDSPPSDAPACTSSGRRVPALVLSKFLTDDVRGALAGGPDRPTRVLPPFGRCGAFSERAGHSGLVHIVELAGDWRLLFKARSLLERIEHAGAEQAVYESFMQACGYSQYKTEFLALARHVPYDRARQLAREDPQLLEAAYLHVAGLLPGEMDASAPGYRHWERLTSLRTERLRGLRTVAIAWKRTGVRPANFPERRISGVARFIARTAPDGVLETLNAVWRDDAAPAHRRAAFERLFPRAIGFWANHCTWTGKPLPSPSAPIGMGRIRSIVGNVFVPAGLAVARKNRDRRWEERVLALFARLPQEPDNTIMRTMLPRLFGDAKPPRLTFRLQQGILQMYLDWCEPNPACLNCAVAGALNAEEAGKREDASPAERCGEPSQ